MHVFISYGHDQNTPLVDRIQADLQAHGHTAWRDTGLKGKDIGINAGDAWRERIVTAVRKADWVLAFLSQHSTRETGVCLDEVAIALSMRGGGVSTVLVEPVERITAPPTIGDIQRVDMADWAAREAADPAAFEVWYQARLSEILDILNKPENQRYAAEIRHLEQVLDPAPQGADIPPLLRHFVGREWLLERVDAWRRSRERTQPAWLVGEPGQGKSAFAAWLAQRHAGHVIAINLCRFGRSRRNDPPAVIRTLAFQIAMRVPEYRAELLRWLEGQDPNGAAFSLRSPADQFDALIIQPLHHAHIDGGRSADPLLVVVDGLDETVPRGGTLLDSDLARLLAEEARHLPDWMALLVTGRPEAPLHPLFAHRAQFNIGTAAAENAADLGVYVQAWLGADRPELIARIVAASEGNFAYLAALRQAVAAGRIDPATEAHLPRGLFALYHQWFDRQFPRGVDYEPVRAALGVLLAARLPMPEEVLAGALGWSPLETVAMRERLGSLFRWQPEGITPFHQTLRDWLIDPSAEDGPGSRFMVVIGGPKGGAEVLRGYLWARFVSEAEEPDAPQPDSFTMAELPPLLATRQPDALARDLAGVEDPIAVLSRAWDMAKAEEALYRWASALAWWDVTACLADAAGPAGASWRVAPRIFRGDILQRLGDTRGALAAYAEARAIAHHLVETDAENTEWQPNLAVSHERIGGVKQAQGDLPGALFAYSAAMAIRQRLVAIDEGNAEWQWDLSVSHIKIGEVKQAQGDLPGALSAYSAAMEIAQRLAAIDPGDTQWQKGLVASHDRIGAVKQAQGDLPGALSDYSAAMEITQRLAKIDPGNTEWQRDLSVSHENIGDVKKAQDDLPGALSAYSAAMAIRQRLAAIDPGNTVWQRDLSVSHNKIGDVKKAQGDLPGALSAYSADMEIAQRLAKVDPGNTEWQRDLISSKVRIAEVSPDEAPKLLAEALAIAEALRDTGRLAPKDASIPAEVERRLAAAIARRDGA
ncbi:P-loop domain-containing protein [Acidisoma sp. C75]